MTEINSLERLALALSDNQRLTILDLLKAGRTASCTSPYNPSAPDALCASDLLASLADMSPSKLSYHLKELREAGLISELRSGKWIYYSLNEATIDGLLDALKERYIS